CATILAGQQVDVRAMSLTSETAVLAPGQINRYQGVFRSAGSARRWIGKCRCGAGVKIEGEPLFDARGDAAVLGVDGLLYTTRVLNTHELVIVRHLCANPPPGEPPLGRWVLTRPVFDGGKRDSKRHDCNARCTGATGPACDCRCRGRNHGS